MEDGEQCVADIGTCLMPLLCVESWDTQQLVSTTSITNF